MHNTERLREKLAQKQSEMDSLRMEIDNMEARISKVGGEFASGREAAKEKLAAKKITLGQHTTENHGAVLGRTAACNHTC